MPKKETKKIKPLSETKPPKPKKPDSGNNEPVNDISKIKGSEYV